MKYSDILDIIKTREGYTIEFKETFTNNIGKEICAFANAQGGKIILGVKDNGEIKGIKLTNKDISKIQDIARNMNPSFDVHIEQIQDVAIIYVADGKDKPYTINGHFYLRQGANSQQLNRDEIRTFFQKENLISFERQTQNIKEKDFSNVLFNNFKKEAKLDPKLSKKHLLENLNLLTNDKFNNAGLLFFTKNIKKYFPTASIMCFLYSDVEQTQIIDSKEFNEDFLSNLKNANQYLTSKLNTAIIIKNELRHKEKLELPQEALRESIINAMIHKDYFVNSNVQINISPNKVEIINPGKLLFPKSDFGKISIRRNPILVDLFYRLGLVEKAGSGIKRIKRLSKENNIKTKFETGEFFKTIFFREYGTDVAQIGRKSDANRTQIGHKSDTNPKQIQNRIDWILEYLQQNKKIKSVEIMRQFNIVKDSATRDLNNLIKKNKIIRKGAGNNVWYELKPKNQGAKK